MSQPVHTTARAKCLEAENCLKTAKKRQSDSGRIIQAIDLYTEVLDMDVDIVDPYIGIAYLAFSNGDIAKAMGLLLTAKEIDPTDMRVNILIDKIEGKSQQKTQPSVSQIKFESLADEPKKLKSLQPEKNKEKDDYYQKRMSESRLKKIEPKPFEKNEWILITQALGSFQSGHIYEGPEVYLLQRVLFSLGLKVELTKRFDKKTEHALKTFQMKQKLSITGWADGKTKICLNRYIKKGVLEKQPAAVSPLKSQTKLSIKNNPFTGDSGIRLLQKLLSWSGYFVKHSGHLDATTYQALRKFQMKYKLPMTGEVDESCQPFLSRALKQMQAEHQMKKEVFDMLESFSRKHQLLFSHKQLPYFDILFQRFINGLQKENSLFTLNDSFSTDIFEIKGLIGASDISGAISNGPLVENLQSILILLDYPLKLSGVFDLESVLALQSLQKLHGLETSGFTDEPTCQVLNSHVQLFQSLLHGFNSFFSTLEKPLNESEVLAFFNLIFRALNADERAFEKLLPLVKIESRLGPVNRASCLSYGPEVSLLQFILKQVGYNIELTGHFDMPTYHSLRKFQLKSKLPMTGLVEKQSKERMNDLIKVHFLAYENCFEVVASAS